MVGRIDLTIVEFMFGLHKTRKGPHGLTFKKKWHHVEPLIVTELTLLQNLCISQ